MALHIEAKKALDAYAEGEERCTALERRGNIAPNAFAALNAILIACKSAEDNQAKSGRWSASPQISVSGLRAIIARELS